MKQDEVKNNLDCGDEQSKLTQPQTEFAQAIALGLADLWSQLTPPQQSNSMVNLISNKESEIDIGDQV